MQLVVHDDENIFDPREEKELQQAEEELPHLWPEKLFSGPLSEAGQAEEQLLCLSRLGEGSGRSEVRSPLRSSPGSVIGPFIPEGVTHLRSLSVVHVSLVAAVPVHTQLELVCPSAATHS